MSNNLKTKHHVQIGTIGHVEHGKTSLTAAITKYAETYKEQNNTNINCSVSSSDKKRGITIKSNKDSHEE